MPYIEQPRRLDVWKGGPPSNAGELNFFITKCLLTYWNFGPGNKGYKTINDILGAVEGAKLEFYRRVVVPYEEQKIKENGDVY